MYELDSREVIMKKKLMIFVLAFAFILPCGIWLSACGSSDTTSYSTCEEKYTIQADGWKRGIEGNEIISDLSTMGLENVAYDFSYIKEQNFGRDNLISASSLSSNENDDNSKEKDQIGNMKSTTIKFENVDYNGFVNYAEYMFTDHSAFYNDELQSVEDAFDLIERIEDNGSIFYEFNSYLQHGSKYYNVNICYVYSGENSMVSAMEMYVTVPVYLKNKLKDVDVALRLGEVVETWPGWTHLNYAETPMYKYIPSIYSDYYEISTINGLTQIYVPFYTKDMQNFYEQKLKEENFVNGNIQNAPDVLKEVIQQSINRLNGVKYYTYNMINNIWHLAVFQNSGYMQISAYLSTKENPESIELKIDGPNTFDTYQDFQNAFNNTTKNFGISIPFKDYSFIDSYYMSTSNSVNGQQLKVGFKMTTTTPYEVYQQGLNEISNSLTRDFIYQGAGVYVCSSDLILAKQIAGLENTYYTYNSNLTTYREEQYNYAFKETDNREEIIESIINNYLIYWPEENLWAAFPYGIYGQKFLNVDENGRIIYELNYYVTYTIRQNKIDKFNLADIIHSNTDMQKNLLDAEVLTGYIDNDPIVIQKQDNYIFMTILNNDNAKECYKEIIYFENEYARLNYEKNNSLVGNEIFYSSDGVSGDLSSYINSSKIIELLHKFYNLQTQNQSQVDDFMAKYVGDEAWMFKFVDDNIIPSSQTGILSGEYLELLPAYKEMGLSDTTYQWFSYRLANNSYINFSVYYGKNGFLKLYIVAIDNDSKFEPIIDGKKHFNYYNTISETTSPELLQIIATFVEQYVN